MNCPRCGGPLLPAEARTLAGDEVGGYGFCSSCRQFVRPERAWLETEAMRLEFRNWRNGSEVLDVESRIVDERP